MSRVEEIPSQYQFRVNSVVNKNTSKAANEANPIQPTTEQLWEFQS